MHHYLSRLISTNYSLIKILIALSLFISLCFPIEVSAFSSTALTTKYSTSVYATSQNAFYVSNPALAGQCTWYAYGRVVELSDKGELSSSVKNQFKAAFWPPATNRHAKNWPSFLGGTWYDTNTSALPIDKRRAGLIAVWKGCDYGHVGFVEEVNADKTRYRLSDFNRSLDESLKNQWYDFVGTSDRLCSGYPFFFELSLPTTAGHAAVSQGVNVTPTPVVLGQNFNVSFTLKEIQGGSITFEQVAVAIHRSDDSFLFDLALYDNVAISANGTWNRSATGQIYSSTPPGTYKVYIKGRVAGGDWFNFSKTDSGVNPRSFTVESPTTLSSITISGSTQVNESSGAQYTCTANYSDGSSSTVTGSASWSDSSAYATINSSGYLTTSSVSSDQSCTITATYGGKSDTHNVTIKNVPATLSYITISGSTQVNENSGAQYTCTAYYSDGSSSTVTSSASWIENSSYASISSSGYLTTSSVSSDQSCTITASYGGKSDTHNVTIKNVAATLSYITISGSTQVNESSGAQYSCTAYYSDGSSSAVTSSASWSENSSYASISSSGYLTTSSVSSDQSCTITATYGGKSDTHNVTIKNVSEDVGSIRVSIVPQEAADAGAQWKVLGEGIWRNSGTIKPNVPFGTYIIEFKDISGWNTPPNKEVTVFAAVPNPWINSDPYTQICTYSISHANKSFDSTGGTGSVNVTASSSECGWTATSNDGWITITSGSSGSGNGTVYYSVSSNSSASSRTGAMTIAGKTFTVTQSGVSCTYSISPTSKHFSKDGSSGSVSVTTQSGCSWSAGSNAGWVTITSGSSGSGNGTVSYSVSSNSSASQRTGTMTIAGKTFTVTQDGVSCTYSISPTSKSFTSIGGTGSVSVTAPSECSWSATSNGGWITITSGSSGSGNGTVYYSVSSNSSASSCTGTMTIAGKTFTVTQSGVSCTYSILPTSQSFNSSGGTGSVSVTTESGCDWTATSNDSWISITSGSSGSGNGTVYYSVSSNSSTSSRTGTMTIAGKVFTVWQYGPDDCDGGYMVTSNLWIKAVINTVEKGPIEAVWQKGGEDTTSRGDRVIWGHFYASPSDVTWGSQDNPDLFVKIWFDVSGRVDVNYFHVSVPDIDVYSDYPYDGTPDEQGTTTMDWRYIRQYYQNGQSYSEENYEDGYPPAEYWPTGNPSGYSTINDLSIGSIINTVEKGPIDALWQFGGQDTTARGDQAVWGHFYASPSDVTWGSQNNPDLFVKIWFDVSGRVDVNFFHVSVPDIEVYSALPDDGAYDQKGTTIMDNRYIRHEYWR